MKDLKQAVKITLAGLILFMHQLSPAQVSSPEVVAASGNSWQNEHNMISWTLGESFIKTLKSNEYLLAQGFHQPVFTGFPFLLGDANCDGEVNVLDAVTVINYILEYNPEPFCFNEADVDGSGNINILDAVGIINIILNAKKSVSHSIVSRSAHIYLHADGIDLLSDGTLTALQFEIIGNEIPDLYLPFGNHKLVYRHQNGRLNAIVFHPQNMSFAAGSIRLVNFLSESKALTWGDVTASNRKPAQVAVHKHIMEQNMVVAKEWFVKAVPNPAVNEFMLELFIPFKAHAVIWLNDLLGQTIIQIHDDVLKTRHNNIKVSASTLQPGAYILQLHATDMQNTHKVINQNLKVIITR